MPVALSMVDLVLFWGLSLAALAVLHLGTVLVVYVFVRARSEAAFSQDIRHKLAKRQLLPSGRGMKLSYGYVLAVLTLDSGAQATLMYRVANRFAERGVRLPAELVRAIAKVLTNIDISPWARIGPGLMFNHGSGVVIGKLAEIGARVTVCQGVSIGAGRTRVGDDVIVWAGAKVLGDVEVGPRAQIGANAVVVADVPADTIAVGVPANRHIPIETRPEA